jgi:cytidine deaminase
MTDAELVARAREARARAYAPYSRYAVGAAVLTADGRVYTGCNVENASYGLTVCAERVAVFTAVAAGDAEVVVVAVATRDGASMCGACRQVVHEFGPGARVLLAGPEGDPVETTVAALLPGAFSGGGLTAPDSDPA